MPDYERQLRAHLPEVWKIRHSESPVIGWNVRLRQKFDYYTPDEWYCAALLEYVQPETVWLDVGCGRHILPQNPPLARLLADRCKTLVGIDPSDNVMDNPFLQERAQSTVEGFSTDRRFNLITMRMVAEHIADPETVIAKLSQYLLPGGRIVIYTVWKWAPVSIVAKLTPMSVHHAAKRVLWNTEERDTFPVVYAMNTKRRLNALANGNGLEMESFLYLDDCRSFQRWKSLCTVELVTQKALHAVGVHYPELCLLTVFRKPAAA